MAETEWVKELETNLYNDLRAYSPLGDGWEVSVDQREKLAYAHEIFRYDNAGQPKAQTCKYQADLLISDLNKDGDWIPRVILECKLGISTHDVLTYSAKASTHKHVHPYLRYGLLIGGFDSCVPSRAIRHGAFFDFMMYWESPDSKPHEWKELLRVLREEIQASRTLEGILAKGDAKEDTKVWLLHRQLIVK